MADATNRVHHAVVDMIAMRGCKRPGSSVGQPEAVLRPIVAPMVRHHEGDERGEPEVQPQRRGCGDGPGHSRQFVRGGVAPAAPSGALTCNGRTWRSSVPAVVEAFGSTGRPAACSARATQTLQFSNTWKVPGEA